MGDGTEHPLTRPSFLPLYPPPLSSGPTDNDSSDATDAASKVTEGHQPRTEEERRRAAAPVIVALTLRLKVLALAASRGLGASYPAFAGGAAVPALAGLVEILAFGLAKAGANRALAHRVRLARAGRAAVAARAELTAAAARARLSAARAAKLEKDQLEKEEREKKENQEERKDKEGKGDAPATVEPKTVGDPSPNVPGLPPPPPPPPPPPRLPAVPPVPGSAVVSLPPPPPPPPPAKGAAVPKPASAPQPANQPAPAPKPPRLKDPSKEPLLLVGDLFTTPGPGEAEEMELRWEQEPGGRVSEQRGLEVGLASSDGLFTCI